MIDGIYESIINEELKNGLDSSKYFLGLEKMSPKNAKFLLTSYLKEVTQQALDSISEMDTDIEDDALLLKEVNICNDILDLLRNKLSFDEYKELNISENAEILRYAFQKLNNPSFNEKTMPKPLTSLIEPTLFTNSPDEVRLITELKNEIETCDEVCFLVSFIRMSGFSPLRDSLEKISRMGKKIRVITTTYMQATQYNAIYELAKIPNVEIKVSYDVKKTRLHAKTYIFKRDNGFSTFYIGSSNITGVALNQGSEWNVKLTEKSSKDIYDKVLAKFESYWNSKDFELFENTEDSQSKLKNALDKKEEDLVEYYDFNFDIRPFDYQEEILDKLEVERKRFGRYKNLVVAATGVGKTVIAAFDFKRFKEENPNCRMLYIAHREEILKKSLSTFRHICKDQNLGELYVGNNVPKNYDILFLSVHAANKLTKQVNPDYYDYIVIDEFHHAAAKTYKSILEYFEPKILLGLTATPERMDGQDVTEYFDYHIAAEIRLPEAINKGRLVPFQYYGLTDSIDYSGVTWRNGQYDIRELDELLVENEETAGYRADLIIENLKRYVDNINDVKGLGFCCSIKHAEFMEKVFNKAHIKSLAVTSKTEPETRKKAIADLESGKINFIFTRDLYNEGVDIKSVNMELFLRPTDSLTIFLQQLGRGLRLNEGKECLTVLDFIGQSNRHFNYSDKLAAMIGNAQSSVESYIKQGFPILPVGCNITLEKKAMEHILDNIKINKTNKKANIKRIRSFYENSGKKLTLKNFLKYYNMNIYDLYTNKEISFYGLKKEAGLLNGDLDYLMTKNEKKVIKRLSNLFFIDSPILIDNLYKLFNEEEIDSVLIKNMIYYTFYEKKPSAYEFDSIDEALKAIVNSKLLKNEILEILSYVEENIEVMPVKNDISFENPLEVYSTYSKNQIISSFDIYNEDKYFPIMEGVYYFKDQNHDILFVTLNKDAKDFTETTSYKDYVINDETFHWQTQSKTSISSPTFNRYVNSNGRISLFVRQFKKVQNNYTSPFIYLGECDFVSASGNKPVSIIWHLKHKIPGKFLEKFNISE